MKAATRKILKIIISIVYIIWGIYSPISAIEAIVALNLTALLHAAAGILMLLAGIFGLLGIKRGKCRLFGIIIFVLSLVSVATALPFISANTIVTAVLAWLFITCI